MSQFPNPYAAQHHPLAALQAPAQRAGILMLVLGVISLLFGVCMGLVGAMFSSMKDKMPPETMDQLSRMESELGISAGVLFVVMAVLFVVYAILFITLGIAVRSGRLGVVITSLVLTSLMIIYFAINSIALLFSPQTALATVFSLALLGAHVLLLVWLIQAARNASAVKNWAAIPQSPQQWQNPQQQMAQQQYYQNAQQYYQQQAQQYGYPQALQQPPPPGGDGKSGQGQSG